MNEPNPIFIGHENDTQVVVLKYGDMELKMGYTYICALCQRFSTADFSSGDYLKDHCVFAKFIDRVMQEMGKRESDILGKVE